MARRSRFGVARPRAASRSPPPPRALDPRARPAPSSTLPTSRSSAAFIIQPASPGAFAGADGAGEDWSLWQASEAGSVLVGSRRARRRRSHVSDHWRKLMSTSPRGLSRGGRPLDPPDVADRIASALEDVERERERLNATLAELERGNKGADVCAAEVKRLKVAKLRLKDDAARLRRALEANEKEDAGAKALGEGSFGKVFLGRDPDRGVDVAVKVEDASSEDPTDASPRARASSPLATECAALERVVKVAGPLGYPRPIHFGAQRVFGRPSRVLVMDLLGPSLEDMSWAVSAGGPLSSATCLKVADQALRRVAGVHAAGLVHGDVKADNLLLGNLDAAAGPGRRGAARTIHLVDFGLAVEPLPPGRGENNAEYTDGSSSGDGTRSPTYSDDVEALVFCLSDLRAGGPFWASPETRRAGLEAVLAARARVAGWADLASDERDGRWMFELLAVARGTPFGTKADLEACRGIVARAFENVAGGRAMRETPFDWEEGRWPNDARTGSG